MNSIDLLIKNDSILFEHYLAFDKYTIKENIIEFISKFKITYIDSDIFEENIISKTFDNIPDDKIIILQKRLVEKKSLQEIANEVNLTRERIRQIEDVSIRKIISKIPHKDIIKIKDLIKQKGILFLDEKQEYQFNYKKKLFVFIITHKKTKLGIHYDKDLHALIVDKSLSYKNIQKKILDLLDEINKYIFNKQDIMEYLTYLFPKVSSEKILHLLLNQKFCILLNNQQFFFGSQFKTKREKVEFIYSLFPEGIETNKEIDKLKQELDLFFPGSFTEKDKKRNIAGLVSISEKLLLWDWGRYIHIKFIKPIIDEFDFSNILDYLDKNLKNTQIDLESCFNIFKEELLAIGIPNKYALHTSLKLKYPYDFSFQDAPWIAPHGVNRRELSMTLRRIMTENRAYTIGELVEKMQTNKTRILQLIDRLNDIIAINTFLYRKREFINISDDIILQIINFANQKVKELNFIYIDLIIDQFKNDIPKSDQIDQNTLLLDLLKKTHFPKDFNISNTRLLKKDYKRTKNSLNFHILLLQLMESKSLISLNEITTHFLKRGLKKDRIINYFLYSNIKKVIRIDKETFTSIKFIGLDEKQIEKINIMLEKKLKNEEKIEDVIENFNLPNVKVDWNRFILTDILDHNKFIMNPSRENPVYLNKRRL